MKRLLLAVLLLLSAPSALAMSAFCQGFQAGYQAGACHGRFSCMPPMPPMCPMPGLGESTYQDGYNRGFLMGVNR